MRQTDDPAWLEAQYDNRARVPAHRQILDNWAAASRRAREGSPRARLDLAYGELPGERLDLFPAERADAPVLVFIHGGYWRTLDKSDHSFVAPSFNADGVSVVVPNHSLCPEAGIEQIALQMTQVLRWVLRWAARQGAEQGAEQGVPAPRIALAGHSAGAHLATMLLCCRWRELDPTLPPQPLAGALAISGLYDLEPLRRTPSLQADLRLTPAAVARLSPAFFPRPKRAPLYAVVGIDESDEFKRHNRLIRDVWGPTAVPICETVPGADHFTVLHNLADPAGRLHHLALRLLGLA